MIKINVGDEVLYFPDNYTTNFLFGGAPGLLPRFYVVIFEFRRGEGPRIFEHL